MPRKLTRQEAHEFLDSKPGWIVLSTLDPDGYPHTVPLGYFRLGATLHTKPEETLHYAREAAKRRGVPESELPTDPRENAAYIRVVPHRFRSWDYSADA
jgi:hypothetical protein